MLYRIAADLVMVVHFAFIAFVIVGGFLVLWKRRLAWAHVPCALWGVAIEFRGWLCPLTPLENDLRRAAGAEGYAGGFVDHYITPIVYPPGLTREMQVALGSAILALNVVAYALVIRRSRRARPPSPRR